MKKLKNFIKAFCILIFIGVLTFINDEFIRVYVYQYNNQLRLVDHFLASISIPIIVYLIGVQFHKSCIFYFSWCTFWELHQFISRGYFQYDQYMIDIFGLMILIYLYKIKIIEKIKS
ncbi:hypothetical protein [Alkaliphilus sp. B6464]|uniref:hypothetical protein n=1 Tax=Alkaliphilus sp. B6464 TaxID=2731219 RepID=UPI001BAE4215|nr:hypothetical protein [Alkaliphilus sp. B6464]QUH21855.1 hypothetical protein HYG84_18130 [Alkaliphilus sp. B6464]